MPLTTSEELLEISIGDRMVSFTGRVLRANKSKDGKHLFVTFACADGSEVSMKAFEKEAKQLQPHVKIGAILCFEGLKADSIYKEREEYTYDFELKFERYSTVIEEIEETICNKTVTDFSELENGKKCKVECIVTGKILEIGNNYLGASIVDENGRRGELYINASMDAYNTKYSQLTGTRKILCTGYADTKKGVHLTVDGLTGIEHMEVVSIELPKRGIKRSASPINEK